MNKYQKSIYNLVHLNKARGEVFIDHKQLQQDIDILWELYNKYDELTKTPTLEEIKKEWEALGYEWRTPIDYLHMIYLVNYDDEPEWLLTIKINTQSKRYWKIWDDGNFDSFTFEEHNLLTKTFRALGWLEDE